MHMDGGESPPTRATARVSPDPAQEICPFVRAGHSTPKLGRVALGGVMCAPPAMKQKRTSTPESACTPSTTKPGPARAESGASARRTRESRPRTYPSLPPSPRHRPNASLTSPPHLLEHRYLHLLNIDILVAISISSTGRDGSIAISIRIDHLLDIDIDTPGDSETSEEEGASSIDLLDPARASASHVEHLHLHLLDISISPSSTQSAAHEGQRETVTTRAVGHAFARRKTAHKSKQRIENKEEATHEHKSDARSGTARCASSGQSSTFEPM
ncbi:hypothetical protein C8R45DRAFT_1076550 [Mycena sanguinolenta]|nr:hypothetical protein C8R45DRAFT_1076550 [Mycena sanguinolenta]